METITCPTFSIPALGFGTYQLSGETAYQQVRLALDLGYRHIDTAQMYNNEAQVGQAIRDSGVPRQEIFVTTKVWVDRFDRDQLPPSVDESLIRLQMDSVDLLLLHWPSPDVPLQETLTALMTVQDAGTTRFIGVSNFTTPLMQQAVAFCGPHRIVNNQVEYHPFLLQNKVLEQARSLEMTVTAYRPIAKGKVFESETLTQIGSRHGKTAAQVTLRWLIQQGVAAIPRSSREDHTRENFEIFDFALSDQEMAEIDALRGQGRMTSPSALAPEWDVEDLYLSSR